MDLDLMCKIVAKRFLIPNLFWGLAGVGLDNPQTKAMKERFNELLHSIASERREYMERNMVDEKEWNVLDRLLLSSTNQGQGFSTEEVINELRGFFAAGFETTANTLTWTFLELCRNPEVVEKLRKELDPHVMSKKNIDFITILPQLSYLDHVLKESQRLHSVVITTRRDCTEPVHVMGHDFPTGSAFIIHLQGIHLDPKIWPDPLQFKPERFEQAIVPGTFLPFADGPMKCIGFKMAQIEAKVIIAKTITEFNVELVPDQDLTSVFSITHGLKNGLKIHVTRRNIS
jgi:cytochrome P450